MKRVLRFAIFAPFFVLFAVALLLVSPLMVGIYWLIDEDPFAVYRFLGHMLREAWAA